MCTVPGLTTLFWTANYWAPPWERQFSYRQSFVDCSYFSRSMTLHDFSPSSLACLLILPLFRSCLCNHSDERLLQNWLPGILALTIFLLPLPWCSLGHHQELWWRYEHWDWVLHNLLMSALGIVVFHVVCCKEKHLWWLVIVTLRCGHEDKI